MLAKYKLSFIFFLCLLSSLLVPHFFPFFNFLFFAPFLITSYYQHTLWVALWLALGMGVIDDLLSTTVFGLSSCNYVLVSVLLYRLKRHFFEDSPSTIFIMTLLFSLFAFLLKTLFMVVLGDHFSLTFGFIWTDLLLMPLFEGIYAYFIFAFPYQIFRIFKRFWMTKEH